MASPVGARPTSVLGKTAAWEAGVWRSLVSWIRRRPIGVGPDDAAFGYAAAAAPALWVFVALSAVEIPLLHFLIPWPTVQVIFLLLGAWGLLWMVGLVASLYVHPHVITGSGLRIRSSIGIDLDLSWDDIEFVALHRRTLPSSKTVVVEHDARGAIAYITVSDMTNLEIEFREPMVLDLPKTGGEPIAVLRCYADDAPGFLAEVRRRTTDLET